MRGHDEVAERVFSRGDRMIAEKKRRNAIIRRTVYAVSGSCAAAVVGFGIWHDRDVKNAVTPHPDNGYVNIEDTKPIDTTTTAAYTTEKSTSRTTTKAETTATVTTQDTTKQPVIQTASTKQTTAATTTIPTKTTTTTIPATTTSTTTTPEELFTGMTTAATTTHAHETATSTTNDGSPVTKPTTTTKVTPTSPKWEDLPIYQRFSKFEREFQIESDEGDTETKVYVCDGKLFDVDRYGYKLITWREKRIYAYETTASGREKKHSVVVEYAAISTNDPVEEDYVLQFPDDNNFYIYRYKETIIT